MKSNQDSRPFNGRTDDVRPGIQASNGTLANGDITIGQVGDLDNGGSGSANDQSASKAGNYV
jgi:hypothetical protein